jgi:hypothetical protein
MQIDEKLAALGLARLGTEGDYEYLGYDWEEPC